MLALNRYLSIWFAATAMLVCAVAAINLVVDPYGLFRLVDRPGFNSIKPTAAGHGAMSKAYQLLRVQPKALILGNSRAEVGLDPNHPGWPTEARPVYNAALPGTGTATSLLYLQHTLATNAMNLAAQPKKVLWGIDLMDFLTDANASSHASAPRNGDRRLFRQQDSDRTTNQWLQLARDYGESTLTLTALLDSIQTIVSQRNPYAADVTPQGFNPMHDYIKISADEGSWAVFRQKDQANTTAFLHRHTNSSATTGQLSRQLLDLKEVLRLCRLHGIELQLFIYPYHAHLLEIFRITGHWESFESWKRAVVQTLTDESRETGKTAFPLWDFSSFNEFTTESIPSRGDHRSKMRWYWEAGHFKSELGSLMLDRMLLQKGHPADFGVLLSRANVDAEIAAINAQELAYRTTHADEIDEIAKFAAKKANSKP